MSGTVSAGLLAGEAEHTARRGVPVEVMSGPVVAVRPKDGPAIASDARRHGWARPDTPVRVVARVMRRTGRDAVPVVTGIGRLLDMVTSTDLVAGIAHGTVQAGQVGPCAGPTAGRR